MDRRTFAGASLTTLCAAAGPAADPRPEPPELYELRTYALKPANRPRLDEYLRTAYLPALKRHGAGPVGVFVAPAEKDVLKAYVLAVHKSADAVVSLPAGLAADAEYRRAAEAYLAAKPDDPAYMRIESSLLAAIPGMPRLERPDPSKPRLFNLRVYESHNERAAAKKVEMFETGGELAIFRRVGLTPVLFASAVVGAAMPNLTYLLVFPDEAGRKAAWGRFVADPEWKKLRAEPGYADKEIVSRITNLVLTPASYSEL